MNPSSTLVATNAVRPVTLSLYNLTCVSDTQSIERILQREPGVMKVYANPATEKVYIEYETAHTDPDRLRTILQQAGFGPKTGLVTCAHCR